MLLTCLFHTGFAIFVHLFALSQAVDTIPGGLTFELVMGPLLLFTFALWRHPLSRDGKVTGLSSLYRGISPGSKTLYLCLVLYVWGRGIVERHHLAGAVTDNTLTHPVMISAISIFFSTLALTIAQSAEAIRNE